MGGEKFRILIKNINVNAKVNEIKKFFKPIRIKDAKILKRGVAVAYFKSKEDLNIALQTEGEIHGSSIDKTKPVFETVPKEKLLEDIKETGRLFVRNLSYDCTEDELRTLFADFGDLSECHLSYDKKLQRSKGFAFITYLFPDDAVAAFNKLDKTKFKNRLLHILPGKPEETDVRPISNEEAAEEFDNENDRLIMSEFQKKRHAEMKSLASVAHNWNALFVTPDAVATYLSAKFNVSKEELLNPAGSGSVAVRLAHGEAQLVHEIRDFLQRQGVRLDLLTSASPQNPTTATALGGRRDKAEAKSATTSRVISGRVFLLKNLPVGSTQADVEELVRKKSRKGAHSLDPPTRIIVPPLGITAILEYDLPQVARLAYKALAYEPYNDNVLFVQWAPEDIFKPLEGPPEESDQTKRVEQIENEEDRSKYFRFDEDLEENVEYGAKKADATEKTEVDGDNKNNGIQKQEAKNAVTGAVKMKKKEDKKSRKRRKHSEKEGTELGASVQTDEDGGELPPKIAKSDNADEEEFAIIREPSDAVPPVEDHGPATRKSAIGKEEAEQISRILIVRNISFQANQNELKEFFKPIGGLLKVRMPKKPSGGHRGFAFVEFASEDQAKSALVTFGINSHFMGRRLNIEYAKTM
ncbi:hypothetical protein Aperf_G00000057417 [Anoplocephala perfoliata]